MGTAMGTEDRTTRFDYIFGVPFFVRDLALGDEVETNADLVLGRVIQPSGHVTFRVWFGGSNPKPENALPERSVNLHR